jgi:predicted transcriptional regulator
MIHYQQTSREAYESFEPLSGRLDNLIMLALHSNGPLTCQEIEARIFRSHQAVSGNLRHLVERGYVEKSGQFGFTQSGRKAIKWQAKRGGA